MSDQTDQETSPAQPQNVSPGLIKLGMHTDNWRPLSGSFNQAVDSAVKHQLPYIEFGVLDGQNFIEGLGYDPAVPLETDELQLRRSLEERQLQVSQIDAAYPLPGPRGAVFGVPYIWRAIRFAHLIGCPYVDSTDGATKPAGYTDEEVINMWRLNLKLALERAESFKVGLNIEPHGPYTNDVELMVKILKEFDSPYLGVNFDTGNTFIAGNDPLAFMKEIRPWLRHVHCKDVAQELAEASRGEDTGIASSGVSIGQGVNASNIKACIDYLKETAWEGVFSIETLGSPNNIQESVDWVRAAIAQ